MSRLPIAVAPQRAVIALLALLLAQTVAAADKPVLNWMVLDLPPGSKPVKGKLTDGTSDAVLKLVFQEMPEHEHRIQVVNTARAMANLSEGVQACFGSAAYTTERERIAYFTLTNLVPPVQLVVRADVADQLPRNEAGEVVAAQLFNRPDLRGLLVPQRSYSPSLDSLLSRRAPGSGIRSALANDGGANILKMLKLKRADYAIEYDFVVNYLLEREPELTKGPELKVLPIAGLEPFEIGIACPHTEWGRQTIQQIDAVLTRISVRPEFRKAVDRWLSPDSIKRHQKLQNEFFLRRARPSDPGKFPVWPSAR